MIRQQTNLHFSGHSDKSKGKPSRPRWHFAYLVWLICHCDGLILHNYAIVDAWWPSWSGWRYADAEWRARCFAANCVRADDIRGDEYSEVTYSTQRAMAGDKNKHAVGLSACVLWELLNIIMRNRRTKHVTHHTNSLFTMNISFQTLDMSTRWQHFPNNVTYTYNIFWQTGASPRARQLSFNSSSAMGSMCHPSNHESSLCFLFIYLCC